MLCIDPVPEFCGGGAVFQSRQRDLTDQVPAKPYPHFHGRVRRWKIRSHLIDIRGLYRREWIQGTEVTLDGKNPSRLGRLRQRTRIDPRPKTRTIALQKPEESLGIVRVEGTYSDLVVNG